MPDKLTDSEIVKAFECCATDKSTKNCRICPLNKKRDMGECLNTLEKSTLDLINHLQAENNLLRETNKQLSNSIDFEKVKDIAELKAENERLEEEIELLHSDYTYKLVKKKTKAEAYKECIEKINKNLRSRASFGSIVESIICESIIKNNNNLLKELVSTDFTQMFMGVKKLEPIPNNEKELVGEDNA